MKKPSKSRAGTVAQLLSGIALSITVLVATPPVVTRAQEVPGSTIEQANAADSLRRVRDAFVLAEDYEAALDPARQLVERPDLVEDPSHADDIIRLAGIQASLEDFEAAELNFLDAIELVREAEGEFSITLVEPYQALGRTYIRSRQFPEAVTALEQAQHISQRNLGLFNVTQTDLIEDLTTAQLGLGDTVAAQELQLQVLDNAIRRFGSDAPQTIPFRYRLATYYEQSRMRSAAREQYEQVVATLEARPESSDEALLEPLRQLLRIEMLLRDQEQARPRILAILENADIGATERGKSLAALGDWAIVQEDIPAAVGYYRSAYELLQKATAEELDAAFGQPAMLDFIAPLTAVDRGARSDPYTWGHIVLRFDVSADGRASNVETVEAEPAEVMDDEYSRRIRETHFRPRIVAGEPRATQDVQFTHQFRYYVDDE